VNSYVSDMLAFLTASNTIPGASSPPIISTAILTISFILTCIVHLEIILFGDESQYNLSHERIEFRHCTEKIEMEDEPVRAIKRKKE
jgi:fatty acid/phospholipid biosynthesis enzyme